MAYESREDKLARWDRELGEARAALTLGESIVMALRDGRATSGASQRDRAEATGLSKSTVARLESDPGRLKLDDVVTARYGYDLPSPEWTWYRRGRSGWQISTSVASDLSLGSGQADTDRAAPRPPEDPCAH
ncbi:hypothetical protein GCM10009867_20260 [Pedococcus aerophilus]|uniref:HTH cro/C1-type domain-containing protein n=1 Tax=Pedococcus aerophilus TaxID=436356 RepID=A0ABN3UNE4_9MICO